MTVQNARLWSGEGLLHSQPAARATSSAEAGSPELIWKVRFCRKSSVESCLLRPISIWKMPNRLSATSGCAW